MLSKGLSLLLFALILSSGPVYAAGNFDVIEYGKGATENGEMALYLDFYAANNARQSNCTASRPTLLVFHGGGFKRGHRSRQAGLARSLTKRGYNVLLVGYRLEKDKPVLMPQSQRFADEFTGKWRNLGKSRIIHMMAAYEDAVTAVRWMAAHSDKYCIDINHYGVWGNSAGAVTALNLAYLPDDMGIDIPAPKLVIDYAGLFADTNYISKGESAALIIHGNKDKTVPYRYALSLDRRLKSLGIGHSFYTLDGVGHGTSQLDKNKIVHDGRSLNQMILAFMDAHLKDDGQQAIYESVVIVP